MTGVSLKSIFSAEFIARMAIGILVGSVTVWVVGDRLLAHALGGDRARLANIETQVGSIVSQVNKQEKVLAEGVGILKALQLDNPNEVRQLFIDILGKTDVDDKKVQRVVELFTPLYEKESFKSFETQEVIFFPSKTEIQLTPASTAPANFKAVDIPLVESDTERLLRKTKTSN